MVARFKIWGKFWCIYNYKYNSSLDWYTDIKSKKITPDKHTHLTAAHDRGLSRRKNERNIGALQGIQRPCRVIHLEVSLQRAQYERISRYVFDFKYKLLVVSLYFIDLIQFLEANGINDEDLELEELSMDPEQWTPAIHLYYNDDLTAA